MRCKTFDKCTKNPNVLHLKVVIKEVEEWIDLYSENKRYHWIKCKVSYPNLYPKTDFLRVELYWNENCSHQMYLNCCSSYSHWEQVYTINISLSDGLLCWKKNPSRILRFNWTSVLCKWFSDWIWCCLRRLSWLCKVILRPRPHVALNFRKRRFFSLYLKKSAFSNCMCGSASL